MSYLNYIRLNLHKFHRRPKLGLSKRIQAYTFHDLLIRKLKIKITFSKEKINEVVSP